MGVRNASSSTSTRINTTLNTAAETIICTTGAIGLIQDNAQVILLFYCFITTPTGTTSVLLRIRRGVDTTGTLINSSSGLNATVGQTFTIGGSYTDTPGVVTGQQYTLTFQAVGASAVGAVNDANLCAMVL